MPTAITNAAPENFIIESELTALIDEGARRAQNPSEVSLILSKAAQAQGLGLAEAAVLMALTDQDQLEEFFRIAHQVKQDIYGRRLVLFAPLYLSDYCVNDCRYCSYQHSNDKFQRRRLTPDEVAMEARAILAMGHKRLALEAGEDPRHNPISYILECIAAIYAVEERGNRIRRVNVNIAATTVEEYAQLKAAGIGTYVLFQETYHEPTYRHHHPRGPKSDYLWHLTAMHRAMSGGLDDVGLGVLFGLYDWRFETLAMLKHAEVLEKDAGVGPHTFSVPRIKKASGVDQANFPYLVADPDFKKIVAALRLTAPYAGLLMSTREGGPFRAELIAAGVSQISAGSCTGVGGYAVALAEGGAQVTPQFAVDEHRSHLEIIKELLGQGYLPSYCTACYREGRTGDRFMELAKNGQIQNVCHPNAILTFQEYLEDFADQELKALGQQVISSGLEEIKSPKIRERVSQRLALISQGQRDFRE